MEMGEGLKLPHRAVEGVSRRLQRTSSRGSAVGGCSLGSHMGAHGNMLTLQGIHKQTLVFFALCHVMKTLTLRATSRPPSGMPINALTQRLTAITYPLRHAGSSICNVGSMVIDNGAPTVLRKAVTLAL
jgi:hypothetical protein